MTRLPIIDRDRASGNVKKVLDGIQSKMGMVPNIFLTMANSPTVLAGFVCLRDALEGGILPARLREQVCLATAEANRSEYCVAGHTQIAKTVGLSEEEILDARHCQSSDRKVQAALRFAWEVVDRRGDVTDDDVIRLRDVGYTDEEVAEIIGVIGLNTFGDYFAQVAQPEMDFPRVPEAAHA